MNAMDDGMDAEAALTKKAMETIIEHGHQVVDVFLREGDEGVPFAYTVGRSLKDRPELLITGSLPQAVAAGVLNSLAAYDDQAPLRAGTELPPQTILTSHPVRLVDADPDAAEMNRALRLFGDSVTALQVLWPDKDGRFPGDPGFPDEVEPRYPLETS